uniref:Uncharacterized protein n=2 Tax=Eutreptiella gymnastica TaxID=73025 RepID=A0A7S4FT43_9EUGL
MALKNKDPAVSQLCSRVLRLPASYLAFPSTLLMFIYEARHPRDQEPVVPRVVLDVLSDLSQRTEEASGTPLPRDLHECKRLLENVLTNLYKMVSRQGGGAKLLQQLINDKHLPLQQLLGELKPRNLARPELFQKVMDSTLVEKPEKQREKEQHDAWGSNKLDAPDKTQKVKKRLKKVKREDKEDAEYQSDDPDDDDMMDPDTSIKRRRKKPKMPGS